MNNRFFHLSQRKAITQNPILAVFLCALAFVSHPAFAQQQSFPVPSATGVIGKKDSGALAEIKAHLLTVSSTGWQDLQATATLTYPDGDANPATLYLRGSKYSRLDIEIGAGMRSLRLSGFVGSYLHEKGNQGTLPPAASSAGIVAFPRVWTDAATSSRISLNDQNIFAGEGQNLHRITMEYPIESAAGERLANRTAATDLYFDRSTHFLLYSVEAVKFRGEMQTFRRVTAYEDYQPFSGVKVPTTIKQYLNGQLQWTLQLSQVTINPALPTDAFSF